MTLRLNGATSGFTEIDAPAVAGSNTLVLPGGNGSAGNILGTDGAGNLSWVNGRMVLDTAKASTSGTSVDFTGIPSWAKRITVMFQGVSTNGTSFVQVQIGSGSVTTTGYSSNASYSSVANTNAFTSSGFGLDTINTAVATHLRSGILHLALIGSNTWAANGNIAFGSVALVTTACAGISPSLSGALDRIRITTVNGTDTFDAGSIGLLYEG